MLAVSAGTVAAVVATANHREIIDSAFANRANVSFICFIADYDIKAN